MWPGRRGADPSAAGRAGQRAAEASDAAAGIATSPALDRYTGRAGSCLGSVLGGIGRLLLPGECVLCGASAGGDIACAACRRQYIEAWRGCGAGAGPRAAGGPRHAGAGAGAGAAAGAERCGMPADSAGAAGSAAGPAPLRCRICAHPLPTAGIAVCAPCLSARPAFDATYTVADYALPLDRLVLQLKFGGRLALARLCGEALADVVLATPGFTRPDLLCPVPLGPHRLAQRGYNQALEIARPLARRLPAPLQARLAVRVKETDAQSLKGPEARRANIAGAFAIPDRRQVEGRHIGVVDDVMTTGATMQELAALLRRYGAARVTCLVFARTALHDI